MLRQRILTALVMAPVAIAGVFLLPLLPFAVFVGAILVVAGWEWANLSGFEGHQKLAYAAVIGLAMVAAWFVPPLFLLLPALLWWCIAFFLVIRFPALESLWGNQWVLSVIGFVLLVPGFVALVQLKGGLDNHYLIMLLFLLIWGADIGAYFSGRAFGKAKLAPRVSPGKSWAGFWGGMASAVLIAAGMSLWLGKPALDAATGALFLVGCLGIAAASVVGDLTISMFKRHRQIKDSSNLLPGHGGFLDRLDSLLAAGPLFCLFLAVYGWS